MTFDMAVVAEECATMPEFHRNSFDSYLQGEVECLGLGCEPAVGSEAVAGYWDASESGGNVPEDHFFDLRESSQGLENEVHWESFRDSSTGDDIPVPVDQPLGDDGAARDVESRVPSDGKGYKASVDQKLGFLDVFQSQDDVFVEIDVTGLDSPVSVALVHDG